MHEWEKKRAAKRGGGLRVISLDAVTGEGRYGLEPVENETAETIYERRWALTLLEGVLDRLRQEYATADKSEFFNELKPALTGDQGLAPYVEIAQRLGMTEGALKVAIHRLRQRYGELLREEVANTVASNEDVEAELRYLITALGN
jgi:RNA polymerase sigma-70 factor (ECF subfamily)